VEIQSEFSIIRKSRLAFIVGGLAALVVRFSAVVTDELSTY